MAQERRARVLPAPVPYAGDDHVGAVGSGNNLIAAGALLAVLTVAQAHHPQLVTVSVVTGQDGNPTNQIDIGLRFLASRYRITVERVAEQEAPPDA